jgi:N-acetylneuraminic acid mutarotase
MGRNTIATVTCCLSAVLAGCGEAPDSATGPEATDARNLATASNTWVIKHSLSPWREAMAAATINGLVYVAGGRKLDLVTALARVDVYNLSTDTWSTATPMPAPRVWPNGASMINGKLYVSGGKNAKGVATRTLFVYDPGTKVWSRKADVPQPSCGGAQGVISGKLYAYTGCYAELSPGGVFFRYDPATDSWIRRAAPPLDHWGGVAGVINGKLYLVGGYTADHCRVNNEPAICDALGSSLQAYDPASNAWTSKALMPFQITSMSAVVLNGKLYVVGGQSEFTYDTQVYDPGANTWTQKARVPRVTELGAAAVVGGKIVYVSGRDNQQPWVPGPSKTYVYTP